MKRRGNEEREKGEEERRGGKEIGGVKEGKGGKTWRWEKGMGWNGCGRIVPSARSASVVVSLVIFPRRFPFSGGGPLWRVDFVSDFISRSRSFASGRPLQTRRDATVMCPQSSEQRSHDGAAVTLTAPSRVAVIKTKQSKVASRRRP